MVLSCWQVWDEVFNFLVEHKVKDLHVTVFLCHPVEGDKVPALLLEPRQSSLCVCLWCVVCVCPAGGPCAHRGVLFCFPCAICVAHR